MRVRSNMNLFYWEVYNMIRCKIIYILNIVWRYFNERCRFKGLFIFVLGVVLRKWYDICFCIEKCDFLKEIESSIWKDVLINYIVKKV